MAPYWAMIEEWRKAQKNENKSLQRYYEKQVNMLQEWSTQGEAKCKEKLKETIEKVMTTANRITEEQWSVDKSRCKPAGSEAPDREETERPEVLRNIQLGMPKGLSKF